MKHPVILHVDMDAFFAAVEQLSDPRINGKPVMVCGNTENRTVVCAATYESRRFGVSSGTPLTVARAKCPQGIFIEGNPEKYVYTSIRLVEICREFTPVVEPYSVDESFLDITGCMHFYKSAVEAGKKLKKRIREECGLSCSVGIAPNKILAKTASALHKPDGLTMLTYEDIPKKYWPLPIGKLLGVGGQTQRKLQKLGVDTIGNLAEMPVHILKEAFGVVGEFLHEAANGRDDSLVIPEEEEPPQKSVGNSYTLPADTSERWTILRVLLGLSSKVGRRLRAGGYAGRTVTVTIRFANFKTITRTRTLPGFVDLDGEIYQTARSIFEKEWRKNAIRLLGVSVSNLVEAPGEKQNSLFDYRFNRRYKRAVRVADTVNDRYGENALTWGNMAISPKLTHVPFHWRRDV